MPKLQTVHEPDPFGFDPVHLVDLRAEYASDNPIPPDSPAGIVTRAAKLMHERANAATPRPWRMHDTHLNHGGHTATILSGEGGDTALCAWLPTWSSEPWNGAHNAWNNAAQIAGIADPGVAHAIANAWEHQADDMTGDLAHFHPVDRVDGEQAWAVVDERESTHYDWTATVEAALAYLREDAPAVTS
jgi:hypothetical protein